MQYSRSDRVQEHPNKFLAWQRSYQPTLSPRSASHCLKITRQTYCMLNVLGSGQTFLGQPSNTAMHCDHRKRVRKSIVNSLLEAFISKNLQIFLDNDSRY